MFETGISDRLSAKVHEHPVTHLLIEGYGGGWVTWCGGGPATVNYVPTDARLCRKCKALAEERRDELEPGDHDARWKFLDA